MPQVCTDLNYIQMLSLASDLPISWSIVSIFLKDREVTRIYSHLGIGGMGYHFVTLNLCQGFPLKCYSLTFMNALFKIDEKY